MGRPASRRRTFRPFSVSSLAAQPPVIPDPMTMASYSTFGISVSPVCWRGYLVRGLESNSSHHTFQSCRAVAQHAAPGKTNGLDFGGAYRLATVVGAGDDDLF